MTRLSRAAIRLLASPIAWCTARQLDPLDVERIHIELYLRWFDRQVGSINTICHGLSVLRPCFRPAATPRGPWDRLRLRRRPSRGHARNVADLHQRLRRRSARDAGAPGRRRRDPIEELLELPGSEAEQLTEYVGMRVALPGETGLDPDDPSASRGVSLDEPGRYLLLCFIPEGADVQAYREDVEGRTDGPPQVDGGPPHAAIGMASEITLRG